MSEKVVSPEVSTLIESERLKLLFQSSYPAALISLTTSALLVVGLWEVNVHTELLIRWSVLALSSVARIGLFSRYKIQSGNIINTRLWERVYFITLMFSSIIWGVGGLYLLPLDSTFHQAIMIYFMMGMSAGAASVFVAHRAMALSTVAIILLPISTWMLMQDGWSHIIMGVSGWLFFTSLLRSTRVMALAYQQNFIMSHELKVARDKAEKLARIDMLTGLYNRRAFYEQLDSIESYSERYDEPLAIIMVDLDNFKDINDSYGHAVGDSALIHVGNVFNEFTRQSDICARVGGEEFGIIMRSSNLSEATDLAEKLRQNIFTHRLPYEGGDFAITASFGVASGSNDSHELVKRADTALYKAKTAGRNQVVVADSKISRKL